VFICVQFNSCTDFYLRTEGSNISCTSYTNPCGSLDYIMMTLINNSNNNHTIYIDSGIHNYSLLSFGESGYINPFYPLINVIFTFIPYISSSFFSSSDISTYPVILTNRSGGVSPFLLYANTFSSFHCLIFLIGISSSSYRYVIWSFFFSILFLNEFYRFDY
jgi:hypothetical protein